MGVRRILLGLRVVKWLKAMVFVLHLATLAPWSARSPKSSGIIPNHTHVPHSSCHAALGTAVGTSRRMPPRSGGCCRKVDDWPSSERVTSSSFSWMLIR